MARCRILVPALPLLLALSGPADAVEPDEIMPDPAMERRARDISTELRCVVCQNQSIDDSDAPLARDLRVLIRERLRSGDDDSQIRDFVVRRYGEFVLLKPVLSWHTALLWLGPILVLLGAGLGLLTARRRSRAPDAPLTAEEESKLLVLGAASDPTSDAIKPRSPSRPN